MSAIASFYRMPKNSVDELRTAAVPKRGFFGSSKDVYWDFIKKHGEEVASYPGSGYVLAAVVSFLQEMCGVDFSADELADLGTYLSEARQASVFPLTREHKERYLERLMQEHSESDLRDYYNDLFAAQDEAAGVAMKQGIAAIRQALTEIDEDSFVLLQIG